MWRPAWREFVPVEAPFDKNLQPTFQDLITLQLTPVKPTDASKHDCVHCSGHIDEWHLVNVQVVEAKQHTSTPISCV